MKKLIYGIGWFVDKIVIGILLLIIWLPFSIILLPNGLFNPFKREIYFWEYVKDCESECKIYLSFVWTFLISVFTFLFFQAPIFTSCLISLILICIVFWYCYKEYKIQNLRNGSDL